MGESESESESEMQSVSAASASAADLKRSRIKDQGSKDRRIEGSKDRRIEGSKDRRIEGSRDYLPTYRASMPQFFFALNFPLPCLVKSGAGGTSGSQRSISFASSTTDSDAASMTWSSAPA